METIGWVILGFFAAVGFFFLCYRIASVLLTPTCRGVVTMVVPLCGHVEDAEYRLRYFADQYRKLSQREDTGWLICLDTGMDEETRRICEGVCETVPFMNLCTKDQLEKLISG
jgi:hypothetical protein